MEAKRWYEKISDINDLVLFVEKLSPENQDEVAQHFFQILIYECGIDLDKEFSKFSENDYSYKRWYDNNYQISSALELLKHLPEDVQNFVVNRVLTDVVISFSKKDF
ncbi:MAG: hypothetical protein ACI4SM_00665 [Candidatus Gastranaerophilaceae bacterium]